MLFDPCQVHDLDGEVGAPNGQVTAGRRDRHGRQLQLGVVVQHLAGQVRG